MEAREESSCRPHISFSPCYGNDQYNNSAQLSAPRQSSGQWFPHFIDDFTYPSEASKLPSQNAISPLHSSAQSLLILEPFSTDPEAVKKLDVQSLLKPAEEGWRPPLFSHNSNQVYGYQHNGYARSTGVMTEPFRSDETSSVIGSDLASQLDSGFFSCEIPAYRQDIVRDDRSEYSAVSGAVPSPTATRPQQGRHLSDGQVLAPSGRRRRSSQPLPVCGICRKFWPKNRSDQVSVPAPSL
jgi:hypothetical protein